MNRGRIPRLSRHNTAERSRLATGHWPETLEQLTPEYLPRPLTDPYTGGPLHLVRRDDGLIIYSVGPDLKDNGGTLDPTRRERPGTDVGCQLWDVNHRRQKTLQQAAR